VINEVRRRRSGAIVLPTKDSEISSLYFDVSGDNSLSPLNALRVINSIARARRAGQAEGEALTLSPPVTSVAMQSSSRLSDTPESQLVVRSENTPDIDIDAPVMQPFVERGTPAKAILSPIAFHVPPAELVNRSIGNQLRKANETQPQLFSSPGSAL